MKSLSIANDIIIPEVRKLIDEGHSVTFRLRGDSMRPFLEDRRDKVVLQPCRKEICRGDVLLVEDRPRHYVLHRVVRVEEDRIILKGDGNVSGTEQCLRENVIGIAKGFQRKGRTTTDSVDGLKWKVYSLLWMNTQPLRRILLALYRRVWLKIFPVKVDIQ